MIITSIKSLRLQWLIPLWMFSTGRTFAPPIVLAYDAQNPARDAYDQVIVADSDCDATVAPFDTSAANAIAGRSGPIRKFAVFVVVEGAGPLLSTTSRDSMDSALLQRIQTAFRRNGSLMRAHAETTRLLNFLGTEVATLNGNTIVPQQSFSTSGFR
jgi:hypothetical protein